MGTVLLLVGLSVVRGRSRARRVRRGGLSGTARVQSLRHSAVTAHRQPLVVIGASVSVPGRPLYRVTLRTAMDLIQLARLQPGNVIPVRVDPRRPKRVEIDWLAPAPPGGPWPVTALEWDTLPPADTE
ncbi:hypothetical protein [Rugosimonospora acidiphila]